MNIRRLISQKELDDLLDRDHALRRGFDVGWVYIIQAGTSGSIKIGHSKNPDKRLRAMQTSTPTKLRLIGVIPGTQYLEAQLHQHFAAHRRSGEWFNRRGVLPELMQLVLEVGFLTVPQEVTRRNPRNSHEPIKVTRYSLLVSDT